MANEYIKLFCLTFSKNDYPNPKVILILNNIIFSKK